MPTVRIRCGRVPSRSEDRVIFEPVPWANAADPSHAAPARTRPHLSPPVGTCPHPSAPARTRRHLPAPVGTRPHPSAPARTRRYLPAPVGTCPHPSAPARTRRHPPAPVGTCPHPSAPARTRRHLPAPVGTRPHLSAPARTCRHPPAPVGTRPHPPAPARTRRHPPAPDRRGRSSALAMSPRRAGMPCAPGAAVMEQDARSPPDRAPDLPDHQLLIGERRQLVERPLRLGVWIFAIVARGQPREFAPRARVPAAR